MVKVAPCIFISINHLIASISGSSGKGNPSLVDIGQIQKMRFEIVYKVGKVNNEEIISLVKRENLYTTIRTLEGIRHPLDAPDVLLTAGNSIFSFFEQLGCAPKRHYLPDEGPADQYFNVECLLGDGASPLILVTSHYDTVYNSPGADDNASAVAIMLEVARIVKQVNLNINVGFVSFTLEEGSPRLQEQIRNLALKYGVFDNHFRFTSHKMSQMNKQFVRLRQGKPQSVLDKSDWQQFEMEAERKKLSSGEKKFFVKLNEILAKYPTILERALRGSMAYSEKVQEENLSIQGIINLETIGYTNSQYYSQTAPEGLSLDILDNHKVNTEQMVGDFALLIADNNSYTLSEAFFENTKQKAIDLKSANLSVPLDYENIQKSFPDLLRSDHAPFWKQGIPAIMVTDTANFRNPHYHTGGDTIETLDFSFMKKVCQATLATVLTLLT